MEGVGHVRGGRRWTAMAGHAWRWVLTIRCWGASYVSRSVSRLLALEVDRGSSG